MKKSVLLISLFSGAVLMLPNLAFASDLNIHTLTHTPKPELSFEFVKLENAYKVAGVCFLGVGDCNDSAGYGQGDEDYTMDTAAVMKIIPWIQPLNVKMRALLLITVTLFKFLKVTVLTTNLTSLVASVPQTS